MAERPTVSQYLEAQMNKPMPSKGSLVLRLAVWSVVAIFGIPLFIFAVGFLTLTAQMPHH
jgi:hypothetical protein